MILSIKLALSTIALIALPSLFLAAPAWATDFSGTCTQFNSATGPFVNITITDTACVPITKAITATSGLVNIQVNTLSAQNITSGASGALTISSTGSISALAIKSGTNQPLTVGSSFGTVTATTLTSGKDLTLNTSTGVSTISGNISAVGNINVRGSLVATINLSGTVKSTGAAGAGSINISALAVTTGDISTTNNTVTVKGLTVEDLDPSVTTGSITTTDGFITVSTNGQFGAVKTGALQTSTAYISVSSTYSIDIEGLVKTTQGYIFISAPTYTVKVTGAISTTGVTGLSGNVYITAGSTLQTGAITSSLGGSVDINAQTMGGSSLFTIGGSGQTNGVNGKITTTGAPANLNLYSVWVNVANGPTGATGGIMLTATDDISVDAGTGARLGTIVLNAQNGPLTIPAGTMTVAGTGAIGGGQITLLGATVTFSGASVLDASQATTADGFGHQVNLSASTINYSAGLTVTSSGTGTSGLHGQTGLYSQNAFTAVDSYMADISSLTIAVNPTNATPTALTLSGGALTMTADGDYTDTLIQGYPITISGGNVTLTSQGKTNTLHTVAISNTVAGSMLTGTTGLTFGGATVTLDASATNTAGDAGGFVTITVDQAFLNASTFLIKANGPTVAGNGGNVFITASTLTLNGSSKATITANASSAGIGNAVSAPFPPAIYINPTSGSAIKLGAGAGEFSLSAQGGKTGGNAGSVVVLDPMGSIEFDSTGTGGSLAAINVSVPAGTGEGGYVALTSGPLTFDGTASAITANGGPTAGDGGQILLASSGNITVGGGGVGSVSLSAQAFTSGNGGTVSVTSTAGDISITGPAIVVSAEDNGNGGFITATANAGTITLSGNLTATGEGTGTGGFITISGNSLDLGTGTLDASAGVSGTISALEPFANIFLESTTSLTLANGSILRAVGGAGASSSTSGTVTINSLANVTSNGTVDVHNSASGGTGGIITLQAGNSGSNGILTINGQVTASALTSPGVGGLVKLLYSDPGEDLPVVIAGMVQADRPDTTSARGGSVNIQNLAQDNVGAEVNGLLSAQNGLIVLNMPDLMSPADGQISGEGQVIGAINITDANDVVINMAVGSVTIDEITAVDIVSITTSGTGGDILSDGQDAISSGSLKLDSSGNIGIFGAQRLLTAVQALIVTANTSPTANVAITNNNVDDQNLTLADGAVASQNFALITNNSLTVGPISAGGSTQPGNIFLQGNGTAITINSNALVESYNGAVQITSTSYSTTIAVMNGASIIAQGSSDSVGFVDIEMGSPLDLISYNGGNPNFLLTVGSAEPLIGVQGFTAAAPPSMCTVGGNAGMILYGNSMTTITFGGENTVTANSP